MLTIATKQARKRADLVAGAAGSSVTGIKSLDTSCSVSGRYGVPQYRNMMVKASGAMDMVESAPTQIEPGVVRIYSTVNASFYLK